MQKRLARKFYWHHRRDLEASGITFETCGYGNYMLVIYTIDFQTAMIARFPTLDLVMEAYDEMIKRRGFHVAIHYAYLRRANALLEHEQNVPTCVGAIRLSVCRNPVFRRTA